MWIVYMCVCVCVNSEHVCVCVCVCVWLVYVCVCVTSVCVCVCVCVCVGVGVSMPADVWECMYILVSLLSQNGTQLNCRGINREASDTQAICTDTKPHPALL